MLSATAVVRGIGHAAASAGSDVSCSTCLVRVCTDLKLPMHALAKCGQVLQGSSCLFQGLWVSGVDGPHKSGPQILISPI